MIKGYLFATEEKNPDFFNAQIGDMIQLPERKSPWIIVDHEIHTIITTQWPGRLLYVAVIDPVDNSKLPPGVKIRDDAHYTRAYSVKILEEKSLAGLFGDNGDAVLSVINRIATLTSREILTLGKQIAMGAAEFYSIGWDRWLKKYDPRSPHIGYPHDCTLAISISGYDGPINGGFLLINTLMRNRIEVLIGDEAFIIDEYDERFLAPEWRSGSDAVLYAAMGYGCDLLNKGERWELTYAWERVINRVEI